MYIITCNKLFKKSGEYSTAYVSNNPLAGTTHPGYTKHLDSAHVFTELSIAQRVRDDVLKVADSVTILRVSHHHGRA